MRMSKQTVDPEEDDEDDNIDNDDCIDDIYHDSDFPIYENSAGEDNREENLH